LLRCKNREGVSSKTPPNPHGEKGGEYGAANGKKKSFSGKKGDQLRLK